MKNVVIKCPRCGKEEVIEKAYYRDVISCEHCNFKHQISQKTRKSIKIGGYVCSVLLMLIVCIVVTLFNGTFDNKWFLVAVLLSALVIVPLSDKIAKPIIYYLGLYSYEPLTELKKAKNKK